MNDDTPPKVCPVCKHSVKQQADGYIHCSEFCAETTDTEKAEWAKLKEGEFGYYPCADCGCLMQDMYEPDSHCSDCAKERRVKARVKLLKEVLALAALPEDIATRIRAELNL